MNIPSSKNFHLLKYFLFLSVIEGIFALILFLHQPSMERNAVIFGLSSSRMMMACATLLIILILLAIGLTIQIRYSKIEHILSKVRNRFENHDDLLITTLIIFLLWSLPCLLLLILPKLQDFFSSLLSVRFDQFISTSLAVLNISRPIILWLILVMFQYQLYLFWRYKNRFEQVEFYKWEIITPILFSLLIFLVSLLHWAILYFQLYVFVAIPNWFWKFYDKPVSHPFFFIFLLSISLLIVVYIVNHREKTKLNLLGIIFCGLCLLVGFGYIEKDGFETLRQLFIQKGHWGYARYACSRPGLLETLRNYEFVATLDPFFKTKPPGIFAFYITVQNIVEFFVPGSNIDDRYYHLTNFMAYAFPLLSLSVIPVLYQFTRQLTNKSFAVIPPLLYIFFPNVILTPLFLDQELYPLLLMTGLLFCLQIIRKHSLPWAFITGLFLYTAIYFSFSLLPLIPLVFLWLASHYFLNRKEMSLSEFIKIIFMIGAGILFQYLIFRLLLNYDVFIRYNNAMASHRIHKEFSLSIKDILNAILVNNVEYFSWLGFPILILFFSKLIRSIRFHVPRQLSVHDELFFSFIIVYILLNISGQTHGEVARLWIFMVPLISFFSSLEIEAIWRQKNWGIIYIVSIQLITMFNLFLFQDLD